MSNVFSGKKSAKGDNIEDDFLGGGGVLETDIYLGEIKTAYIGKSSKSDAQSVTLLIDVNGREVRSTIWVSNRDGDVTYKDKKTKEIKNLPGFSQVNSLCLLICGKELGDMDVEELTVKLYDFDAKKEIPQAVDCFSELHGEKVNLAIQKQIIDKTALNDATGNYDSTGETSVINEVIKFFPEDKLVTISEVAHFVKSLGGSFDEVVSDGDLLKAISKMDEEAGNYADKWLDRNKGEVYDKSTGKKAEGKAFGGGSKSGGSAKKSSLFDD